MTEFLESKVYAQKKTELWSSRSTNLGLITEVDRNI